MKSYKVLWFDDEYTTLNIIKENALLEGIVLCGYENSLDGIQELENNLLKYDAVIVDGLFYTKSDQTGDALNDKALFDVATAITRLSSKKELPWFILSGHQSFTKESNRYADGFKNNKVYDKLNEKDLTDLWFDIKQEADKQIETQIRHKYHSAFDVCAEKYIGKEAEDTLLFLLKSIEETNNNTEDKLNAIRKIIEKLFSAFLRLGSLPSEIVNGNGSINNSSKFLCGTHPNYEIKEPILVPVIAHFLKNILQITQDGSHSEGSLNLRVDHFIKNQPSGYLFNSVIFQLLEILIWFKGFADENSDVEKNKSAWSSLVDKTGDWINGKVHNLNTERGFAFFKPDSGTANTFIPPQLVALHHLTINEPISVLVEVYLDEKDNTQKTRVKNIKK